MSSRTYLITQERDLKHLTLQKPAELCEVMEVHPLTLLTRVRQQLETVLKERDAP